MQDGSEQEGTTLDLPRRLQNLLGAVCPAYEIATQARPACEQQLSEVNAAADRQCDVPEITPNDVAKVVVPCLPFPQGYTDLSTIRPRRCCTLLGLPFYSVFRVCL